MSALSESIHRPTFYESIECFFIDHIRASFLHQILERHIIPIFSSLQDSIDGSVSDSFDGFQSETDLGFIDVGKVPSGFIHIRDEHLDTF